jgi:ATP-binding cassette subfamily B protein/subfamily B ATP-binding cassette protein MsbA
MAILGLTLLTTGVALLIPLPLKVLIDNVVGHHSRPAYVRILPGSAENRVLLIYVVAAELLFFALASALDVALTFLWIKVGQKMVYTLSEDLFARLQRRSLREHAREPVGELLERVAGDSWAVYTVADELLFTPLHALLAIAGIVFVMTQLSGELTLVACVAVPVMAVASVLLGRRVKKPSLRYRELQGELQSHVQQTLSGIGVVQAFSAEERQQRRFRELTGAALRSQLRMAFAGGLTGLGAGAVASVGMAAVLVVGGHQVLGGALTVGSLVIFLSYVNMLQAQLGGSPDAQDQPDGSTSIQASGLMSIYPKLQSIRGSVDRVVEVLDAPVEVVDAPGAVGLGRVAGHVVFDGVWFGYEPGRPVLRGVDFVARPGEVVAVVGATGAGKSTLVSLLPRFFDPDAGRVLLDGHDLREVKLAGVRASVSLVLQESFLFAF